jgi:hypothetical protein
MSSDIHSVRLSDGSIVQIHGRSFSIDADPYPGTSSKYRADFRLICGSEVSERASVCVLEVVMWDEQFGTAVYAFAQKADNPGDAIRLLDQLDPLTYLPLGTMQPHDVVAIRTRYDERARRFRDQALEYFKGINVGAAS